MSSWVRYSIAVYVGLLISGALARQPWRAPIESEPADAKAQRESASPTYPSQAPATPVTQEGVAV